MPSSGSSAIASRGGLRSDASRSSTQPTTATQRRQQAEHRLELELAARVVRRRVAPVPAQTPK